MRKKIVVRGILALILIGLLLAPISVQADLKATNVVYAWDYVALKYQNSNVIIPFDGGWVPFWHELDFDNDPWADACGPGTSTPWAGVMYYGLYSRDNNPLNAPGFQETRNWELVDCDRTGDGAFNNADLALSPPESRTTIASCTSGGTNCNLLSQDVVTACTSGNCADEIVTTFFINLDANCDGALDSPLPTANLCFYAEARTPPPPPPPAGLPFWAGPLQARISTVGGDKTVNFNPAPMAIDLASFAAAPQGNGVLLTWETATEFDNLGFRLYRAGTLDGQRTRLNQRLIPSQSPGSAVGAAYTFLDETAAPGNTYYYWLEDVDVYGVAVQHGPAVAEVPLARALPGRPRPAPRPNAR